MMFLCKMQYLGADDQNWGPLAESRGASLAPTILGQRITTARRIEIYMPTCFEFFY